MNCDSNGLRTNPRSESCGRPSHFLVGLVAASLLAATAGASIIPCAGDCGGDEAVTIDELITGVNIVLGNAPPGACPAMDLAGDGEVTVDDIIKAVNKALTGCFDTIALPKLPASVEVVYDSLGIPHIYGPDLNAVAFAQGYIHAAHRFWQMDVTRRAGEGRLSELFGMATLKTDVTMRTALTARDGRRLEEAGWEYMQAVDPEVAASVQAYTDGVNAWLADLRAGRNSATLPPEYSFALVNLGANDLADWRPQDSVAVGRALQWNLDRSILTDTLYDLQAWETLDEAAREDTLRAAPLAFVTVVPAPELMSRSLAASVEPAVAVPGAAKAVLALLQEVEQTLPFGGRDRDAGSNNWVVAPSLSASGFAMLASDPHLSLANPPNWFLQQFEVAGNASGQASVAGVPGLPGGTLGFTDMGAWGATYTDFDVVDVYVETVTTPPDYPASPRTVLFNGQQVPVLRLEEQFNIKGRTPRTYVIEVVPHHGPMLPDPNLNDGVVGLAATGMTQRWTGYEPSNDFRTLLGFMRATNVADFRAALRSNVQGANLQNYLWADVHGDIAYSAYGRLPQRPPGTTPYLAMPGTGEAEWLTDDQGNILWLPEDQVPQALNPAEGFIASANSDPFGYTFDNDPLNDPAYLAFWYAPGIRLQRIQDMLSNRANLRPSGAKITMADMSAYQYDSASLSACRMLPFLFTAAETRPELVTAEMAEAIARLQAWTQEKPGSPACDAVSGIDAHDVRADVPPRAQPVSDEERADAVGSALYHVWMKEVYRSLPAAVTAVAPFKLMLHLLEDIDSTDPAFVVHTKGANGDSTLWDDPDTPEVETRTEVLLAALSRALTFLQQQFASADMSTWLWGKLHQVQFQHAFAQALVSSFDLGPMPAPGGTLTVNVANFALFNVSSDSYTFDAGPSQRLVVVLDPSGVKAVNILPGGENGNPGSAEAYNTINPATHYGDLIPGWLNGEPFECRVSRQAVAADNQRHVKYVTPAEQGCLTSGGTVSTAMCCLTTGNFPDTCAVGACGCAPDASHDVQVCSCGAGSCFDGSSCVR